MGWAARLKIRSGNPAKPEPSRFRGLNRAMHKHVFDRENPPKFATMKMSDRTYLVDKHGTVRRASVEGKP